MFSIPHSHFWGRFFPVLALVAFSLGMPSTKVVKAASGAWMVTGSLATPRMEHTATLLPNGQVLVVGGRDQNYTALASAELYNPATGLWTPTGNMTKPRSSHKVTLLQNGKVLVVGPDESAELYNPATGLWTTTGSLGTINSAQTATLLINGKVLVTGSANAELYNPATGAWTATSGLSTIDDVLSATRLQNGKVLAVGKNRAELYDPNSETWTPAGSLAEDHFYQNAILLADGKVLVVGGSYYYSNPLDSAEVYDPATGHWSSTGSPMTPYSASPDGHTATLLQDGKVLLAGGSNNYRPIPSAELYDSSSGSWISIVNMTKARHYHTATLLPNGSVLVVGGPGEASAELYDPAAPPPEAMRGSWTLTRGMRAGRSDYTATLLPDGKVLVTGGRLYDLDIYALSELYDPVIGAWIPTGSMPQGRFGHSAVLLANGKVLVVGGRNAIHGIFPLVSAELYDPVSGTWTPTGSMLVQCWSDATLLQNGKVLATGSGTYYDQGNSIECSHAELYDPVTGLWTQTSVPTVRGQDILLKNGEVLKVGRDSADLLAAELYDPTSETWTPTSAPTKGGDMTLLKNGKVLAVGSDSAELYDPISETWTPTSAPTKDGSLVLLHSGKVLVVRSDNAELYDPNSGEWSPTGSMVMVRDGHLAATLLSNGKVLVAGGMDSGGYAGTAELYNPEWMGSFIPIVIR